MKTPRKNTAPKHDAPGNNHAASTNSSTSNDSKLNHGDEEEDFDLGLTDFDLGTIDPFDDEEDDFC